MYLTFPDACVSLGMVMVTWAANSKEDGTKRRVVTMLGIGMVAVFFSLLLSVFRNKAGGYPYRCVWERKTNYDSF